MKIIHATITDYSGQRADVYATGEYTGYGNFRGAISVFLIDSDSKSHYAKSLAEVADINYQVIYALTKLRRQTTIGDSWQRELTRQEIRELVDMQSLFHKIFNSDGCFLKMGKASPPTSPVFPKKIPAQVRAQSQAQAQPQPLPQPHPHPHHQCQAEATPADAPPPSYEEAMGMLTIHEP